MAGRGGTAEAEDGEGYFASVSDLMVGILFVFLLMLTVFALSYREAEQEQTVALERYERLRVETERQEALARAAAAEAMRQEAIAREATEEAIRQQQRAAVLQDRNKRLQSALDAAVARLQREIKEREEARADLLARLAEGLAARGVAFRVDQQSGVLRLSEDVPFDTGRSDLTERTRRTVQVLADVLQRVLPCFAGAHERSGCGPRDMPILEAMLIEGHTDRQRFLNLSPQQSQQENDRLSAGRALTVFAELRRLSPGLDALRNADGVPILGVSGYGERRPLPEALGGTDQDFARNRRIDLRFIISARTSEEVRRLIDEVERLRGPEE